MVEPLELIGYVASFFVAISLVMSSFLALRVLNLIGAVAFVVYGALLGSIPVLITNGFIAVIDIYFLVRMVRPDLNGVRYIRITEDRRGQLDDFIDSCGDDILRFFPDFSRQRLLECFQIGGSVYLALKDLSVVGFAMVHPVPPSGSLEDQRLEALFQRVRDDYYPEQSVVIPVDYIVRRYRGLGLVQHLHREIVTHHPGETKFILAPVPGNALKHRRFLERTGFKGTTEEQGYQLYARSL